MAIVPVITDEDISKVVSMRIQTHRDINKKTKFVHGIFVSQPRITSSALMRSVAG